MNVVDNVGTVLSWILKAGGIVLLVVTMICVTALIASISNYFDAKTAKIKHLGPTEATDGALSVIILINQMVDVKLAYDRDFQIAMKQPFNILKIDEDAKALMVYIRESLDRSIYVDRHNMLLTAQYIDDYIAHICTTKIIEVYRATNAEIAQINSNQ